MARDGSGTYSLPANTLAVSGDPVSSTKFNSLVQDLESDANVDRPIAAGGTGASTAQAALTNLFSGASPGGADKIGGWDQSASAFAFFSLGSGLSFSGTTIGLDADLVALAGLTVVADNFIVGNSGGTAWEVKTPAQARTSLGLGTSATVNTGTSGATIPLLNGGNTWSQPQLFEGSTEGTTLTVKTNGTGSLDQGGQIRLWNNASGATNGNKYFRVNSAGSLEILNSDYSAVILSLTNAGGLAAAGNAVWHTGNDGAGSGLDADTVDGIQASAFATLSGSETLTNKTLTAPIISTISNTGTLTLPTSTDTLVGRATTDTLTNKTISGGTIQSRVQASTETTGTLTVASANETIQATGDITIPNSVFSAGDCILIYAGASARTITQGSGVTMRLAGTTTTGSRTLAARGVALLFFVSASEVAVGGPGVT